MTAPILMLVSFFIVWLIIAIVAPWKFASDRIKLSLVPALKLSGNRQNYHLEYRIKDQDNAVTEWKSIPVNRQKNISSTISFFPEKRERHPFRTSERVVKMLKQYGHRKSSHSDPYASLINYLQQADEAETAQALQFRIIARKNYGQEGNGGLIFISDWHIQ